MLHYVNLQLVQVWRLRTSTVIRRIEEFGISQNTALLQESEIT